MRASHDLRADLTLLTANKMSGSQQLFGSNNLVVAGSEQENRAAIKPASTHSRKRNMGYQTRPTLPRARSVRRSLLNQ
jgi:hypothetical protein